MQLAETLLQLREDSLNVFIFRNVAPKGFRARKRQNEIFGLLLQTLVLVSNRQFGSGLMESLGDRPGNAAFIGNSKHRGHAAFEAERHESSRGREKDIRGV